ncbi:hypothetical protein CYMTET_43787 [Cymbomonas tetramitiformis]|uniref:Uncharacterized protein n=1 Tax=Cymbomonas tetramitiformis TaxID=36881 RepID=A0AAE0C1J2_9CHLO|nr:hypothetical protein CYMTET_43787 [Cymbomonas tetramitiformis]
MDGRDAEMIRYRILLDKTYRRLINLYEDGFSFEEAKAKYEDITYKIPPIVTAATIPVITLSLLCKQLTGSGLPGPILGTVEGLSYLALPLGFGSLLPRIQEIIAGGDFEKDAILKILQKESKPPSQTDTLGKDATERVASLGKKLDANNPLAQQMADIEAAKVAKAALSEEEIAANEAFKKKLAAKALGMAQSQSDSFAANAEKEGTDSLLSQSVTQTMKESMTVENFDEDITKYDDAALSDKLNLSKPELSTGAPEQSASDKWREQYRNKNIQE